MNIDDNEAKAPATGAASTVEWFKNKTNRRKFSEECKQKIDAGLSQKGTLPNRWKRLEEMYSGVPIRTGLETKSGPPRNINIIKPRLKQVAANVCNPLFSFEPYFAARGHGRIGQAFAKSAEKNVHFFMQRAQFDRRVKSAAAVDLCASPCIVKVHFEDGTNIFGQQATDTNSSNRGFYVGPTFTIIHPGNFVAYPLYAGGIGEASLTGYRTPWRRADIDAMRKMGVFFDRAASAKGPVSDKGGAESDPKDTDLGQNFEHSKVEPSLGIVDVKDKPSDVWELVVKKDVDGDGFEEYYLALLDYNDCELLWVSRFGVEVTEEVPYLDPETGQVYINPETGEPEFETQSTFIDYSRPWYFDVALTEKVGTEFYRPNPMSYDLQEIQLTFNEVWDQFLRGSLMSALPAGFTNSGQLQDALLQYEAGWVYNVDDPDGINWVDIKFNGSQHPYLLEFLLKLADASVSLSQAGQGQETAGDTTATEYSGILEGQRTGMDDHRYILATHLSPIYDFTREMLYLNWDTVLDAYGDEVPDQNRDCMAYGFAWEPMVKGGTNTAQETTLKLQSFMQFIGGLGIPLTPELIVELVGIYMSVLDLPTDMEKLKSTIIGAYQAQMNMQQMAIMGQAQQAGNEQDEQAAFQKGISDGLSDAGPGQDQGDDLGLGGMGGIPGMGPG